MNHINVASALEHIEWKKWNCFNDIEQNRLPDGFCYKTQRYLNDYNCYELAEGEDDGLDTFGKY